MIKFAFHPGTALEAHRKLEQAALNLDLLKRQHAQINEKSHFERGMEGAGYRRNELGQWVLT